MPKHVDRNLVQSLKIFLLAFFVVAAAFLWQGKKGFNLWDEGFLWYGVQRVLIGEVPVRDFMAYDPGRYYWAAALMTVWGDNGIFALRIAVAIFQMLGLFVALLLISRALKKPNFLFLLFSSITLVVWMFPRHKLFDISLSIFLIYALTLLVERPTDRRYLLTGFFVGLVAFFGRNHGMYGAVGSLGIMIWLKIGQKEGPGFIKGGLIWLAGAIAGVSPTLLMALFLPGFAFSFMESVRFLFEIKATNLPLPIPWPWRASFQSEALGVTARELLVGAFFVGTIAFAISMITWVTKKKFQRNQLSSPLVAASFLSLPYAHYAFSRADIGHLAQGLFPLLLGCQILICNRASKVKWSILSLLLASSVWVMYPNHPGWVCHISKKCVEIEISNVTLTVDPAVAEEVTLLRNLDGKYAANIGNFLVTPFWPGAYALLERKSPIWEIYALFPRSEQFENAEIERLRSANARFVFVYDIPLDGRDDLRFRKTHPHIYQYIVTNFDPVDESFRSEYQVFKARGI